MAQSASALRAEALSGGILRAAFGAAHGWSADRDFSGSDLNNSAAARSPPSALPVTPCSGRTQALCSPDLPDARRGPFANQSRIGTHCHETESHRNASQRILARISMEPR